jgi:hypothetical protein
MLAHGNFAQSARFDRKPARAQAYPCARGEAAMNVVRWLFGWMLGIALLLWLGAKLLVDAIGRGVAAQDFGTLDANVAAAMAWVFKTAPWWVPAAPAGALVLYAMVKSLLRPTRPPADAEDGEIAEAIAPVAAEAPEEIDEARTFVPIHEAIDYIAQRTDDSVTQDCFAVTRKMLKRLAGEGSVRLRGRRQIDDPTKSSAFVEAESDIPSEYWAISGIGPAAVDANFSDSGQTFPEPVNAWGSKGLFAKKAYSRLQVDWDDVVRLWPTTA